MIIMYVFYDLMNWKQYYILIRYEHIQSEFKRHYYHFSKIWQNKLIGSAKCLILIIKNYNILNLVVHEIIC